HTHTHTQTHTQPIPTNSLHSCTDTHKIHTQTKRHRQNIQKCILKLTERFTSNKCIQIHSFCEHTHTHTHPHTHTHTHRDTYRHTNINSRLSPVSKSVMATPTSSLIPGLL